MSDESERSVASAGSVAGTNDLIDRLSHLSVDVDRWGGKTIGEAISEIERLRLAIRRLAEQDATLSVCNGNVTVTMDATLTDAERADIEYWLAECERQCSAATDGGNEDFAERWQGRANRAAAMLKMTRGER